VTFLPGRHMRQRRSSERPAKRRVDVHKRKGPRNGQRKRSDSSARKRKGRRARVTPSGAADLKDLLDERTRECDQALEQQAATAQAFNALSRSHSDLQAVLDTRNRELAEPLQHHTATAAIPNMSHELRTPLRAILGYIELMRDGAYGEPSEKMLAAPKRLEANGRHLLWLINDMLDLSKIEAGQFRLELSDYSVADIAQAVRTALEPLAADKRLAFMLDLPRELPQGHGDGPRLTQVLINLVGNAIKFTDAGEVAIKVEAASGSFSVLVRDTGPGISANDQASLFQQADNAITGKIGGAGLGLAISKRIVEMHGGTSRWSRGPARARHSLSLYRFALSGRRRRYERALAGTHPAATNYQFDPNSEYSFGLLVGSRYG
jgi:signal transduction histidine kinase